MKFIILTLIIFTFSTTTFSQEIIHLPSQKTVRISQLLKGGLEHKTLVFGEYHYDKAILKTHAKLIWELVRREKLEGKFTVGWEFLEYDYFSKITSVFTLWKNAKINDVDYLKRIFPNSKKPLLHLPYLDFMAATAKLDGYLIPTNATRATKKILMEQGIQALPAKDQPKFNLNGSFNYFSRFKKIMGNHVPANLLKQYFDAQVYTDNIIATYLENYQVGVTSFLIIGSFHSDYNDGVVRYLKKNSNNEVISFKIVNRNELSESELNKMKNKDSSYGYIADYLVIAE